MSTVPFDTHAYVKKLQAVGFTEAQAEVQAEAIAGLVNEQLATKRDLKELETTLKRDLAELETALKRDLKELETTLRGGMKEQETSLKREMKELELRLTVRLGAIVTAAVGVVAVLVKLL
ncbi:MAG: hypothetical protein V3T00_01145 [bacterium]